jgi:hypothetical protein
MFANYTCFIKPSPLQRVVEGETSILEQSSQSQPLKAPLSPISGDRGGGGSKTGRIKF